MRSEPGAELTCRGRNYKLPPGEGALARGVGSFYATESLLEAHSTGDWLLRIDAHVKRDVDTGQLPVQYQPILQIVGDPDQKLFAHEQNPS